MIICVWHSQIKITGVDKDRTKKIRALKCSEICLYINTYCGVNLYREMLQSLHIT